MIPPPPTLSLSLSVQDTEELLAYSDMEANPLALNMVSSWSQKKARSPWLMIHFHGGGFVAQTSKSHEVNDTHSGRDDEQLLSRQGLDHDGLHSNPSVDIVDVFTHHLEDSLRFRISLYIETKRIQTQQANADA